MQASYLKQPLFEYKDAIDNYGISIVYVKVPNHLQTVIWKEEL